MDQACRVLHLITSTCPQEKTSYARELRHGDLDDERQHQTTPLHFLKCSNLIKSCDTLT